MKENSFEFYVEKFNVIGSYEDADINFLSPIVRRRLSKLDRCSLSAMNAVYSNEIQNLVFSSCYGEVERLKKIIEQYTEAGEVSPNTFAGSVHNYSAGFFLLNEQKSVPYTAISAHKRSISSGLLASVITAYDKTLFCYADEYGEDNYAALALRISKCPSQASVKYRLTISLNDIKEDDFTEYTKLLQGSKNLIFTPLFIIERVG